MPNTRLKLIELLLHFDAQCVTGLWCENCGCKDEEDCGAHARADYLIANGVTFATDNNVGDKLTPTDEPLANCQQWIPVTERLPELLSCSAGTAYSEAVNVLTAGRKVLTAIWDGTDFIADAAFWDAEGEKITHWAPVPLPLPEPPKGE